MAIWLSDYKRHSKVKLFLCSVPNSTVTFVSKASTRRTSDKATKPQFYSCTIHLDILDRGFTISNKGTARCAYVTVPFKRRVPSKKKLTVLRFKKIYEDY